MTSAPERFAAAIRNETVSKAITSGTARALAKRAVRYKEEPDWDGLRERARIAKARAIATLDERLLELEARVALRGGRVHWAPDAEAARRIVVEIARARGVRRVLKSKSMVGEEIEVNAALEAAGIQPIETDLGEFIVQIARGKPTHIIGPAMDWTRQGVGRLFAEKLGVPYTEDIPELTYIARRHLREPFLAAEMGISGANFAVSETGTFVVLENEANARLTTRQPPIHLVLMGIEKVVGTLDELGDLLYILPRTATGQKMTVYVNHFTGSDREFHLVLLDNGRTRVLADERRRDLLQCIRCGACLNVCPVYQSVGGGPYDWTYPGPIGIALSPLQRGPAAAEVTGASSLCGACTAICPVKIDLAHHILRGRAQKGRRFPVAKKVAFFVFRAVVSNPSLYALAARIARLVGPRVWPPGWTRYRTPVVPAPKTFREMWREGIR